MRVNFFNEDCLNSTDEEFFGICDGIRDSPAFISTNKDHKWIAIIDNKEKAEIKFYAIDNCVQINREDGNSEKRCDAMISYTDNILFIELKEVAKDWISGGIEQLERSIEVFIENHDLSVFKKKRAFLANRKHPSFKFSHKEEMQRFKDKTLVRLIIGNEIKVP